MGIGTKIWGITALSENNIAGTGLDVTEVVSVPADSFLLCFDNMILAGHNAGNSPYPYNTMWSIQIWELERVTRGEWSQNPVTPDVKDKNMDKWGNMSGTIPT